MHKGRHGRRLLNSQYIKLSQKTGVCLSLGAVPHNQVTFFTILAFPITDWLTQTLISCHGHDQHPQDDDHQKDEPRRGGALRSRFYTAW